MRITWPEALIEELANRRCIIFLGSGVSATAKNADGRSPKTWERFIRSGLSLVPQDTDRDFIEEALNQKKLLIALQCLYESIDRGTYCHFVEEEYLRPNYNPSDIHKLIAAIDAKIVITTNFDKIYDKVCNPEGHCKIVYNNSGHLSDHIRSGRRLIIKAHGEIDDVRKMIFTKRQYFEAKRDYPEFYTILGALFATNTILFLGCSMDDPDVTLLLENIFISTTAFKPHYAVELQGRVHPILKKDWESSYNISLLEYGPTYDDFTDNIIELESLVSGYRIAQGIR